MWTTDSDRRSIPAPRSKQSRIGTHKIQRWNPQSGKGVEDVITDAVKLSTDIAVDGSAGKVYWTELAGVEPLPTQGV
jgi:hypothetical protein